MLVYSFAIQTYSSERLSYQDAIKAFNELAMENAHIASYPLDSLKTDVGLPLHVVVFNANGNTNLQDDPIQNTTRILIINAIHAGESCGVDATVQLFEHLSRAKGLYPNLTICAIVAYNIGGMLNESEHYRITQNGPTKTGYRANAQQLDLNRDFVKADTKNTKAFYRLFHTFKPHFLFDTHTTNGSMQRHHLTYILPSKQQLPATSSSYLHQKFMPFINAQMRQKGDTIFPYVNPINGLPHQGIAAFLPSARYSVGYAAMFGSLGVITEANKYSPFKQRVQSTYQFLQLAALFCAQNSAEITEVFKVADKELAQTKYWPLTLKLNENNYELLTWQSFDTTHTPSKVSGVPYFNYNTTSARDFEIKYYSSYQTTDSAKCAKTYAIPQAYDHVVELLKLNGVAVKTIANSVELTVKANYITNFETLPLNEKHHKNTRIQTLDTLLTIAFQAGDYLIESKPHQCAFLTTVLHPESEEGYLAWNYFDGIFGRHEWISSFAYDERAAALLKQNELVKLEFDKLLSTDQKFASDHRAQMFWIFEKCDYFEPTKNLYPIYQIVGSND